MGVNFDPANMILYDKGDPIAALRVVGPWIRSLHIKDARRTKVPGTWGEEVAAARAKWIGGRSLRRSASSITRATLSSNAKQAISGWQTSARRRKWWRN